MSEQPASPCSPFWIRHGPCPMAPPPHDSSLDQKWPPLLAQLPALSFFSNTCCDPKSAASSNQWRPGPHVPRVLHFTDEESEEDTDEVASSSLTQLLHADPWPFMPVWVSLPRTPGCMRCSVWNSLHPQKLKFACKCQ